MNDEKIVEIVPAENNVVKKKAVKKKPVKKKPVKKKPVKKPKKKIISASTKFRRMVSVRLRHGAIALLNELVNKGKRTVHEKTSSSDIIEAGLISLNSAERAEFVNFCLHQVDYSEE